jgi:hypothetical protein
MKKAWAFVVRNERHLSTLVFAGGFVLDNIAFGRIDLPWVNALFVGYLAAAAVLILLSHVIGGKPGSSLVRQRLAAVLPLGAQFFLGGLLSGSLILYTRGASFAVSWPFLLLLAVVMLGNEFLHRYRQRFAFQAALLFAALYLYAIFALPIALARMDRLVFLGSGAASALLFAGFLWLLWTVNRKRLLESLRPIVAAALGILVFINVSYYTGILPPLPLSLQDAGIYHALARVPDGYQVQAEEQPPFWAFWKRETVTVGAGTPLYAYAAVFAPVKLTTQVAHRWEKYEAGGWQTVSYVSFPIEGGRDGGYRGYSLSYSVTPGEWRVTIETASGQRIGRILFDAVDGSAPVLHTEVK